MGMCWRGLVMRSVPNSIMETPRRQSVWPTVRRITGLMRIYRFVSYLVLQMRPITLQSIAHVSRPVRRVTLLRWHQTIVRYAALHVLKDFINITRIWHVSYRVRGNILVKKVTTKINVFYNANKEHINMEYQGCVSRSVLGNIVMVMMFQESVCRNVHSM